MPHNNNHSSDLEYQSGACANQANYQGNTYYRHIQQAEEPYVRQEGCPDTSLAHLQGAGQDGDGDGEKARSGGARSTDNWRRQHTAPPPSGNRRRSYSSPISSPTTSASSARGYNNQTKRNPPPPPMARPVRQDAWNQRDVQRRDGQPQAPPPPPPAAAPRDRALTRSATHEPPQRRPPPRKRSPKTPPRRYAQGGAQRAATADPDQTYRNDRSYSDDYPPRRSYSNPSDQGASSRRQRSDRGRHAAQQRSRPRTPERANRNDRSYSNHNDSRSGGASSRRSRGKPQRYRDDYEDDRRRTPERRRHSYSNSSRYSRDSESRGASSRYQTRSRSDRRPTPRDRNRHPVKDEPSYRNDYSYSDDGYPIRRTYSDEEVSRSHGASTSSRQQPASRSSRPSASSRRQPQDRSRRYTPEESVASGYRERRGPDDDAPQRQQQQQHQQQKRGNRQLTPSDLGSVSEIRACEEDDEFRQNRSRGEASANSPSAARPAPAPRQPAPAKPSTRARPSSLLRITLLSCTHLPARPYRDWKDDDLLKETVPNFTLYFESSNGFRHKTRLQPYRSTMYFSDEVFRCPNTAHGEEITLTVTAAVRSPEKSIRIGVAVLYVGNRRKGTQLFTAPVVSQSGTERAKERGVVQLTICEDASEDLRRTKAVLTVEEEAQLNQRLHYHLLSRQPCDLHRLEVFMGHCRGSPLDESGEVLEKHGVVMPNEEGHGRESYAYRRQRTNNHGNATPEQAHPKQQQQEQERKTRGRQQPEEDPSQRAAEPREYREESAPVVYTTRSRQSKRGNVVIVRPIQVRDLVNPDGAPRSSELTSCSLFLTLADRPYPEDVPATKVVDGLDGGGIDNLTYFRGAAKCFGDQPIELPWTPEARMEKCVEVRVHVGASRKEPLLGMCLVSLRHLLPGEPTGKMECTLVQDFGTDRATVCGIVELDLCLLLTPESRRADRTKPKEAEQHRRGQIRNSLLLFLWRYRRDKLHELDPLLDDAAISDYNHFLRELSAFGEQPPFAAVTVRCRRWYPICRSTDSAIVKEPKEQRRLAFTRESVTEANRIEAEQAKEGEQRYPYNGSGRANSLSSEDGEEHGDGRGTSRRLYVAISTGLFYSRGAATTVVNEAEHERKEREEGRVPDPLAKTKEDKASYPLDQSFQLSYVVASDDVITLTLFEEGAGAGGTVDRELGRVTVPLSVLSTGEPQPLVRLPLVMHAGRRGAFAQGAMEVDLHPEGHGFRPSVWPGWDLTLPLRVRLATILYRLASEQLHRLAVIQSTMPNDRELADPHLNRLAKLYTRPQARPQLSLALLGVRGLQKGRYYIKVEHGEDQLFRLKKLEVPDNGTGEVDLRDKRHEVILVNLLDVHHLALRVKVGQAYTLSRNVHVGSASLSAAIASFSDAPNFCEVWVPLFDEGNESITCFVGLSLAYLEQRENGTAIVDHRRRHVPTSAESLRMVDVAQRNVASLLRSYTPSLLQDVHPFVTQFMDPRTAHASMRHVMLRRPIAATAYVKVHALHMLDVDSLPEPFVPEKRILRITARFGDACVASAEHHSFIITPRESSSQGIYRDPFNPLGFMCLRLDIPESVRESTRDAPLLIVLEARGKPKEPSPYASPYVEEEKEPIEPPIELGRAALSLRALLTPEVQQQQQQQQGFITVPVVSGCATDASGRAPPAEAPYYRVPPQQKNGRWFVVADLSLSVHAADAEVEPIPSWLRLAPPLPKVMPSTQQVRESLEKQDTSRLRDLHFDLFERRLTEYAQREEAERAAAARESEGRRQRRQAEEMPTSSYPPRSKHNGQQEEHPQDTSTQRMRNNTSAGADVSRSRGGQGTPPPVSRYDQSSKYPNTSMEISSVTNNHSYTQQLDTTPQLRY